MKIKYIALCLLLVLVSCQRDEEMEIGQVSIGNERLEASYSSVEISCSFQTNVTIKNVQAYLSTEADFSSAKSYSLSEKEKNTFGATIEGLKDASIYYVRYEVSNRWSSKMIDEVSEFKTIPYTIPTVQTSEVSEVRYSTAIVGGVITENGGQEIKECGIVYSKSPNPTIENSTKVESNITKEAYTCTLTNLDFATTYYARAYATNEKGTAYGEEVSFMTKAKTLATVTTTMATNVSYTSAIVGGNVTDDGGAEITERGICYSTSANPTTANTKITSGRGLGQFYCNLTDLQNGTTYYVRAYAVNEKGTAYGEEVSFTTFQHTYENGYEYVDLGLSVKWATFNVGASKVEDYGDYFAWGEVEPKEVYEWSTYKWCKGSATTLTKYNTIMSHGIVDNKTQLELSDDAARANWGGKWRMPTDAELTELRELCTWTWVTQNGKGGYQVNSKSNGNSIFLPASGVYIDGYIHGIDICMYLSNCIDPDHPYNAWGLGAEKDDSLPNRNDDHRYYGQSVRPVYDPNAAEPTLPMVITYTVTQITSTSVVVDGNVTSDGNASVTERGVVYATTQNPTTANTKITSGSGLGEFTCSLTDLQDATTYYVRAYAINAKGTSYGEEVSFTTKAKTIATIITSQATNITSTSVTVGGNVTDDGGLEVTERGVVYSTSKSPTTTNTKVTNGSGLGEFTCNLIDLQDATTYYVRAYAINAKGTAYGEEVCFTSRALSGIENGYAWVDLGLSVVWATMNVGANSPEEHGDYFAWGETEPKEVYDWSTYKWCNGSLQKLIKYNTDSRYGTVDNKMTLELNDDAAYINWGGNWRMPTDTELKELREQCTWTRTTQNGVNGYKVTSKSNGNSIFFPMPGLYQGALYWSSSLDISPYAAIDLLLDPQGVGDGSTYRASGLPVRPVCP